MEIVLLTSSVLHIWSYEDDVLTVAQRSPPNYRNGPMTFEHSSWCLLKVASSISGSVLGAANTHLLEDASSVESIFMCLLTCALSSSSSNNLLHSKSKALTWASKSSNVGGTQVRATHLGVHMYIVAIQKSKIAGETNSWRASVSTSKLLSSILYGSCY